MKRFNITINDLSIRKKIFSGILLTILLITTLTSICIGWMIFDWQLQNSKELAQKELTYVSEEFEQFLDTIESYKDAIAVDSVIQDLTLEALLRPQSFSHYQSLQLEERLSQIIQSTPIIHSVTLYTLNNKSFTPGALVLMTPHISFFQSYEKATWLSMHPVTVKTPKGYINSHAMSFISPLYSYNTGQLMGYIELRVDEPAIANLYLDNPIDSSDYTAIINENGIIQSSSYSPLIYKRYIPPQNRIIFSKPINHLNWLIIKEMTLTELLTPSFSLIILIFVLGILGSLLGAYIAYKISTTLTTPITKLIDSIHLVKSGHWEPVDVPHDSDEIGFLTEEFNSMLVVQSSLKDQLVYEQRQKKQYELDLLQQQINPHFLYNTLDNICALAELEQNDTLIEMVMNLSTFYRNVLSKGSSFITFEEELNLTEAYLQILQVRYYNKLTYTIEAPDDLSRYSCPKLLLQPLVENSVYHGIKPKGERGHISISLAQNNNILTITIKDDGVGMSLEHLYHIWYTPYKSFGLKSTDERLKLYYGHEYGLIIDSQPTQGCSVILTIPLKERHDCD
ncbi:MAG: sensor histidine kinase [Cellulosilyticaceae bacterium]